MGSAFGQTPPPPPPTGGGGLLSNLGGALGAISGPLGLVAGIAGSVMSFAQAKKQREMQQEAQRQADKAFQEAKSKLDVNFLEGLTIAKEPFELEREALAQAGASALQAGIEGDQRGAGAVAGRVLMAQQQQQAQQRAAMSREQQKLNELIAQEESRLQGARVDLDLGAVKGYQAQLADLRAAEAASRLAGVQGIAQTSGDLFKAFTPLYNPNE